MDKCIWLLVLNIAQQMFVVFHHINWQLVKTILPYGATSKPPALAHTPTSKTLEENLQKARQAFIESENSEQIKRTLNHNIRPYSGTRFLKGDSVYFKRAHKK